MNERSARNFTSYFLRYGMRDENNKVDTNIFRYSVFSSIFRPSQKNMRNYH